ncbi:hypothetical protein MMC18_006645 [Xylographa bjoerkii]|nr:hypothetical protein [Xylographa bjoerkii]
MSSKSSPLKALAVPVRTSSKRDRSPDKSLSELEEEQRHLRLEVKSAFKKIKPSGSFDFKYWTDRTKALSLKKRSLKIRSKISMRHFQNNHKPDEKWERSDEHRKLTEQSHAIELEHRLIKKHSQKLEAPENDAELQSRSEGVAFVKLYLTSLRGLNLTADTAERDRENRVRSKFRQDLIDYYCAAHPLEASEEVWCHITGQWINERNVNAAHIFSYKHGTEIMDAIFGRDPGTESELFSPLNGLTMWDVAEEKFDRGLLVIVPNLEEDATTAEIQEWHVNEERGYKIRVVNREDPRMSKLIHGIEQRTWNQLDNKAIEFRSSHRPRSRYLYFHYLTSMLRKAWITGSRSDALLDQLGKRYWATPGPYLRQRFLKAFVREIGHEFEEVVRGGEAEEMEIEGAGGAEEAEDLVVVGVAAQQILLSNEKKNEFDEDDEDDEDDDDDGDDKDDEDFEEEFKGFGL